MTIAKYPPLKNGNHASHFPPKGGGDRKSDHSKQAEVSDFAQTKRQAKISDTQAARWQRLATIPSDKFEWKLGDHTKIGRLFTNSPDSRHGTFTFL